MKKLAPALAVLALLATVSPAQQPEKLPAVGPGGYEMTTYYVGFLYRGSAWTPESTPQTQKLQEAHLANIVRMQKEGKLLVAGPFLDGGDLAGLYIFRAGSAEEARALVATDPAVAAGRLRFELHPWYAARNIIVTATKAPVPSE